MSHDRFWILILIVAAAFSLVPFVFWPGRALVPPARGGWLVRLVVTFGLPAAGLAIVLIFYL